MLKNEKLCNFHVFPGTQAPLLVPQLQPYAPQAARLCSWEHDTVYASGSAAEFMRKTIRENPGEITLLCIGPMTNIATLFKVDEQIPSLLKELILMCGYFTQTEAAYAEWNAKCDPHAAAIVYNAKVKRHISIGLDVTLQLAIDKEQIAPYRSHPLLSPVLDFADIWFANNDKMIFHDPLAAALIFDDTLCEFEQGDISVELASERLRGVTYFDRNTNGAHWAAMKVSAERFFEHYFASLNNL